MFKISKISLISLLILQLTLILSFYKPTLVQAAPLTNMSDTLSRQKASVASNHTIKFRTPTGVSATGQTITITFPAGFNLTTVVFGDIDFTHGPSTGAETDETLAAAAGASIWGAVVASQVLTLTAPTNAISGEVTANDYCIIKIGTNTSTGGVGTNQIINPTAGANKRISFVVNTVDTGVIATAIIADDQVVVTGTTDSTLAYTISPTNVSLGTLTTASIMTNTTTITASTNATSGYKVTYWGGTLTWGSSTITSIGAAGATSSPNSEQFGLKAIASGGTGTVTTAYDHADYALNETSTETSPVTIFQTAGPSATTTYTVTYGANITAITEPGVYTATHTWICTGFF